MSRSMSLISRLMAACTALAALSIQAQEAGAYEREAGAVAHAGLSRGQIRNEVIEARREGVLADGGEAGPSDAVLARRAELYTLETARLAPASPRVITTEKTVIQVVPHPDAHATIVAVTDAGSTRIYTERSGE